MRTQRNEPQDSLGAERALSRRPSTVGSIARTAGRWLVWGLLALVFVRGLGAMLGPEPDSAAEAGPALAQPAAGPSPEVSSFAQGAVIALLEFAPGDRGEQWHAQALEPYLADELDEDGGVRVPERGPPQRVTHTALARTAPAGAGRWLVTVAARVEQRRASTRLVTVAVREGPGGLALYDYPSLAPPPARAKAPPERPEPVPRGDREAIAAMLERFFTGYLESGTSASIEYLLAPGRRIEALREPYEFRELVSFGQVGDGQGPRRRLVALVRADDGESGAELTLSYRLAAVKRDRWLIEAVDTT